MISFIRECGRAFSDSDFCRMPRDARIFHAAAAALDVPPEAVLHVGDDALLDVIGALGAGMQAAWVNRGEHPWLHEQQPHVMVADLRQLCALFS